MAKSRASSPSIVGSSSSLSCSSLPSEGVFIVAVDVIFVCFVVLLACLFVFLLLLLIHISNADS